MADVIFTATSQTTVGEYTDFLLASYLPPNPLPATVFPKQTGHNYNIQQRLIVEKWKRMFPSVPYSMLSSTPTMQTSGDYSTPLGAGTLMDPLYRTPLPPTAISAANDPVTTLVAGSANPKVFHDPILVNLALRRDVKDLELKIYGFNELRDAVGVIPLALFKFLGILVKIGDELEWGDERFEVLQRNDSVGYWKNSTSKFFMALNLVSVTRGS